MVVTTRFALMGGVRANRGTTVVGVWRGSTRVSARRLEGVLSAVAFMTLMRRGSRGRTTIHRVVATGTTLMVGTWMTLMAWMRADRRAAFVAILTLKSGRSASWLERGLALHLDFA
jgi:hypothetical protein